jgi:glucose-6-phosphate isomerase
VNVNAYHQPGVEAGKKAAAAIIELQTKVVSFLAPLSTPISIAELANQVGAPEKVETIYQILRHLHANDRGIVFTGDLSQPGSLRVSKKSS